MHTTYTHPNRDRRIAAGMTSTAVLALACGVSLNTCRHWEIGLPVADCSRERIDAALTAAEQGGGRTHERVDADPTARPAA